MTFSKKNILGFCIGFMSVGIFSSWQLCVCQLQCACLLLFSVVDSLLSCVIVFVSEDTSWRWQIQHACIRAVSTTLPSSCCMVLIRVCGTMPPAGHSSITSTVVALRRTVFVTSHSSPIASLITSLFVRSALMTAWHNNTCSILHHHILHQDQPTPLTARQDNIKTRQSQTKTRPSLSPIAKTGPSLPPHSLHH